MRRASSRDGGGLPDFTAARSSKALDCHAAPADCERAFCERKANLVLIAEIGIEPAAKRQ
jgi:hypothetical protein